MLRNKMGNRLCEKQFSIDLNLIINRNVIFTNSLTPQLITSPLILFALEMIENFLNRFLKTIGKKPTTVSCSSVQYSIPLTKKQITGMLI